MLRRRGVKVPIRHLNNSAGLMNFATPYEMVRSGIITYGMYPSDEVDPGLLALRPALQWLSRVTHVKTLPAGREISGRWKNMAEFGHAFHQKLLEEKDPDAEFFQSKPDRFRAACEART